MKTKMRVLLAMVVLLAMAGYAIATTPMEAAQTAATDAMMNSKEVARILQTCSNSACLEAKQDVIVGAWAARMAAKFAKEAETMAEAKEFNELAQDADASTKRALQRAQAAAKK